MQDDMMTPATNQIDAAAAAATWAALVAALTEYGAGLMLWWRLS